MLAPHPASGIPRACAVAARVADLRYGPGPEVRLVPVTSEGALQAITQTAPSPIGAMRRGGAVFRA
jgi:hypothetical protein